MQIANQVRWRSALCVILGLSIGGLGAAVSSAEMKPQGPKATKQANATATSGAHTRNASLKKKRPARKSGRTRGQQAPTADRISEIQRALAKDGSYAGEPSGKWDSATVEATKRFQAGHGLNPNGKLDALTLHKLGLGSATAGIAAPYTPAASSEARSETSPQANTPRQ